MGSLLRMKLWWCLLVELSVTASKHPTELLNPWPVFESS